MRIAVLSDIHGNLPALEAVLESLRDSRPDAIVVCGDVVPGPMPAGTIRALLALRPAPCFVRGNGDREVLACLRGTELPGDVPPGAQAEAMWCASQLSASDADFLSSFEDSVTLVSPALGEILFCHAVPGNDMPVFTAVTPSDRVREYFTGVEAGTVVCGHTHMQFDRMIGTKRVINAGSVGMPYGRRGAHWVEMSDDVHFRRTRYPYATAAKRIRGCGYPDASDVARRVVVHPHSHSDAIDTLERAAHRS